MTDENETPRWPTSLDRAGILLRLVNIRDSAKIAGLFDLAELLTDLDHKNASQIGAAVISAISIVQERPEFDMIATQLSMIALNLKNLK